MKDKKKSHEETVRERICRALYADIDERRYFFKWKKKYGSEGKLTQTSYFDWKGKRQKWELGPADGGPPEFSWVFDRERRLCFFEALERPDQPGTYDIEIRIATTRDCTVIKKVVFIRCCE